nr:hypothetical protein Iba_chr14aCG18950 [Ipomoea batatas]
MPIPSLPLRLIYGVWVVRSLRCSRDSLPGVSLTGCKQCSVFCTNHRLYQKHYLQMERISFGVAFKENQQIGHRHSCYSIILSYALHTINTLQGALQIFLESNMIIPHRVHET